MNRWYHAGLFLLVIALLLPASAEAAIHISPNNPYRSFNISGINYGSMQWERQHGNSNYTPRSGSSRGWRRR